MFVTGPIYNKCRCETRDCRPDVAEVDAVKVKSVMRDHVSSSRAQPAQVLKFSLQPCTARRHRTYRTRQA